MNKKFFLSVFLIFLPSCISASKGRDQKYTEPSKKFNYKSFLPTVGAAGFLALAFSEKYANRIFNYLPSFVNKHLGSRQKLFFAGLAYGCYRLSMFAGNTSNTLDLAYWVDKAYGHVADKTNCVFDVFKSYSPTVKTLATVASVSAPRFIPCKYEKLRLPLYLVGFLLGADSSFKKNILGLEKVSEKLVEDNSGKIIGQKTTKKV